jgi:hypothetical protein
MLPQFRRSGVTALAALALGLAVAAPASAQNQPTEFQNWQVAGWSFTPGVIFGALFDTNVALASPDVDRNTASDELFTVQPFGQLTFLSPRTTFDSGYRGTVRRYLELEGLNGMDQNAYLKLRQRLTRRVTIFANENYALVPTTDQLQLNGVPFLRSGARYNDVAGGVEARLSRSNDLTSRYEMTWVDFERKDTLLTGGIVNGLHTEVSHRFTDRAAAGGEYGIRWADLNQGTKQQLFQDVGGTFHYRTGERTMLDLAGGFAYLLDRARDLTRTGPYVSLGLTHRAERATITASYVRNYVPSVSFGGTNQSQEARAAVQMPLNRSRLYIQEAGAWRRTVPLTDLELPLNSMWFNTVLGYSVQRWFRIEGYHQYTSQDNHQVAGRINRTVVGVQCVVSEPVRIR